MIKITGFLIAGALLFSGCEAIDQAINDAVNEVVSDEVTAETIQGKDKVVIINEVSLAACTAIKNGLLSSGELDNAETLVTELGVTCETYGKTKSVSADRNAECVEVSLAEWLEEEGHDKIISDFEAAQGEKACVIGTDT